MLNQKAVRKIELSLRKKEILKLVIDAFITTGEPIGSKAVMANMKNPCSSATIRNEMSDLEKMGLLEQPHTSAGRIPTGRGYRVYVDSLMENYTLSFEETLLLNSLLSNKSQDPDEILNKMGELLAKMTGYTVLSFAKEKCGTIDRFEGVYVNKRSFLLVMITSSGKAISRQIHVTFPLDRERVQFLIQVMSDHLTKKELGGITLERMLAMEKDLGEYRSVIPPLLQIIYDVTTQLSKIRISTNSLSNLLSFKEFAEEGVCESVIRELENPAHVSERFGKELPSHLRVHIGQGDKGLDSASFVTCPFRLNGGPEGALCVIGPKRMNYAKVMARLEYLAKEIHAVYGFEPTLPLIETKEH
ncbi:MAG: heat-inducible transcription repressor HrcA [Clostridia bacterium]|nr:heat-inducible transcription repressor HrcA [Clostridia bacterium]